MAGNIVFNTIDYIEKILRYSGYKPLIFINKTCSRYQYDAPIGIYGFKPHYMTTYKNHKNIILHQGNENDIYCYSDLALFILLDKLNISHVNMFCDGDFDPVVCEYYNFKIKSIYFTIYEECEISNIFQYFPNLEIAYLQPYLYCTIASHERSSLSSKSLKHLYLYKDAINTNVLIDVSEFPNLEKITERNSVANIHFHHLKKYKVIRESVHSSLDETQLQEIHVKSNKINLNLSSHMKCIKISIYHTNRPFEGVCSGVKNLGVLQVCSLVNMEFKELEHLETLVIKFKHECSTIEKINSIVNSYKPKYTIIRCKLYPQGECLKYCHNKGIKINIKPQF